MKTIWMIVFDTVALYEKIHELEEKKQSLVEEANSKGTPAEEREKLLRQVTLATACPVKLNLISTDLREGVPKRNIFALL